MRFARVSNCDSNPIAEKFGPDKTCYFPSLSHFNKSEVCYKFEQMQIAHWHNCQQLGTLSDKTIVAALQFIPSKIYTAAGIRAYTCTYSGNNSKNHKHHFRALSSFKINQKFPCHIHSNVKRKEENNSTSKILILDNSFNQKALKHKCSKQSIAIEDAIRFLTFILQKNTELKPQKTSFRVDYAYSQPWAVG